MGIIYRLPGAERHPVSQTPEGMHQGVPDFGQEDIGRRADLVLDPAVERRAQKSGAVDILARGVYLTRCNGTSFMVSERPPESPGLLSPFPDSIKQELEIDYSHVRAYALR